jgi:hypothetical protein
MKVSELAILKVCQNQSYVKYKIIIFFLVK